jgi:hypothetical protein
MWLKRMYTNVTTDAKGKRTGVLDYVKLLRAGPVQKFPTQFVQKGIEDGWVVLRAGKITLHTKPATTYTILRGPGYYCSHCKVKLGDQAEARLHVATEHKDQKSPDTGNPSGYEKANFYDCKKD